MDFTEEDRLPFAGKTKAIVIFYKKSQNYLNLIKLFSQKKTGKCFRGKACSFGANYTQALRVKSLKKETIFMDSKTSTTLMTGLAATMAVGAAAYLMSGSSPKARKKQLQRKAGQAIQAVGEVVDGLSTMMK